MNANDYVHALDERYPETAIDLFDYNHRLRFRAVLAIDMLCREAVRCQQEHGFDATMGEDIALIHSEASEALEDIRDGNMLPSVDEKLKPIGLPSELADIIIRVVGFARKHNIDLADAVVRKMLYNETRPHKHGGKAL